MRKFSKEQGQVIRPVTSETSADAQPAYDAPLITPEEAAARFANGAVVIDVRSDAGRAQDGTIPGSIRADRNALDAQFLLEVGPAAARPVAVALRRGLKRRGNWATGRTGVARVGRRV